MTELSPAILTNDVSDFRMKYAQLLALSQYFSKLHVDFIDDNFLPNKTIMPADLAFLKSSPLTLLAHFMTIEPHKYFIDAKNAGFSYVLFHYEVFQKESEIANVIEYGKGLGLKIGLVCNPETPISALGTFLDKIDMIQLMGVHPGFQARSFIVATIEKVRELRLLSKSVIISVDGGVKLGIAKELARAGTDILVVGSAIFQSSNKQEAIEALQADIKI